MLSRVKQADLGQFLRFCVVGTSNAVIDFGVLNLLLWLYPTTDAWKTLGYNTVAVLLAATNSFFWNKYWTFQKRSPITFQEVYRFMVVAGGTTLMNDTLMWLLSRAFPGIMGSNLVGSNVLKLGAIIGTMSISFFGMRLWVFFQRRWTEETHSLANSETEKMPTITMIYDVDTVILGAIRPIHTSSKQSFGRPTPPQSGELSPVPLSCPPGKERLSSITTQHLPDLRHASSGIAMNRLRQTKNPDNIVRLEVGKETGRIYEVRKESLSIGRVRECDIVLDDPAISRLHASIVSKGNGNYILIDEGSANGTQVDDQVVDRYQRYPLRDGDKIKLGETILVFRQYPASIATLEESQGGNKCRRA